MIIYNIYIYICIIRLDSVEIDLLKQEQDKLKDSKKVTSNILIS